MRPIPELLAPAGSPAKLATALTYGADAVYLGGPGGNLRAKGSFATWEDVADGLRLIREKGRRGYLCINAYPLQKDLSAVRETLEHVAGMAEQVAPHGLIVADPGVLHLARRIAPHLPLHVSTQANTANAAAVAFWQDQGAGRVNLARETDLPSLRSILRELNESPGGRTIELEMFVHGAQCMALSGRCLLSAYLVGRSANAGACAHPCRYEYRPLELEERTRPGQPLWQLEENDGYSTLLAADDLCLLPYLRTLTRAGVDAVKIEGRTKSEGHLAQVLDAYRGALDALENTGQFPLEACMYELMHTAKRTLSSGLFLPQGRRRLRQAEPGKLRPLLGKVLEAAAAGRYLVAVRSPWAADASVEVLVPGMRRTVLPPGGYTLENDAGEALSRAHPGLNVWLRADVVLEPGWFLRLGAAA